MKKIKYLLLGIVSLLLIGSSFGFYADLTSINPVGGSVYNVPYCFFADTVKLYNNGNRIDGVSVGAYNTSITGFNSTNQNSFSRNGFAGGFSDSYYGNNSFIIYNGKSFGFGTSYNSIVSDYSVYNDPGTYGGVRLFFDTPIGSVGNNPLLNFNTNNLNSTGNLPVKGFEYFTPSFTRTNYGYIIDYGTQGKKGRHFGLDSWGYSYGVNFSEDSSKISWNSFSFSSLGSEELLSSLKLGLSSFDHLTSNNTLSLGILVLKNNGYDYNQGGQGKYLLLSKNPNSYSGLLYEIFDCNSYQGNDWLPNIMDSSRCTSLSHGTINGVLPFTDSGTQFDVGSLDGFLGYIFNTSELYGFSYFTDSTLSFNAFRYGGGCGGGYYDYCWGTIGDYILTPDTSSPSIRELYILNGGQVGPSQSSNSNNISSLSSLYYQCLGPSYNTPDGNPPAFCFDSNGNLNLDRLKNCFSDIIINDGEIENQYYCYIDGFAQPVAFVSDGSGFSIVSCSGSCSSPFEIGVSYFNFDNDFVLSTGKIESMFTNITGRVGRCPFPYTDFQLGKNISFLKYLKTIGFKYDPFIFINCVVAGFHQGRNLITNMAGLSFFDTPLLSGNTSQHRILFVFLDFVVILGLLGLISFIRKIF